MIGPVGSGKSTTCCWEVFRRAREQEPGPDGIRRTRWAIVRNTYRELEDTTMKTWWDWFPAELGTFIRQTMTQVIRIDDMEMEILFRALDRPDDVKKLLSLELTGAWVNEAKEIPQSIFDMIQTRVGRYPGKNNGKKGPTWYGVIADTNPPDSDHWIYLMFEEEKPKGWALFHQPSGTSKDAENIENLPDDYYERIQAGKHEDWIKVYVHGEYGFSLDGKPIFPEYKDATHALKEDAKVIAKTLYIGIDFGRTPAAVMAQQNAFGQWIVIDELVTEGMGARLFGELLRKHLNHYYPGMDYEIWGDPAGEHMTEADEYTPYDMLRASGIIAFPAPSQDPIIRREAISSNLLRLAMNGKPGLVVSPKAKQCRKGLAGGYRYRRLNVSGQEFKYTDKPDKNKYSHVCEALEYLLVGAGEGFRIIDNPRNRKKFKVMPGI